MPETYEPPEGLDDDPRLWTGQDIPAPTQHKPTGPVIHQRTTEVTVSAVPEDSINHHAYAITVAWRGEETYAVMHHGFCLGTDGEWEYEPRTSSRTDEWIATHRFDYDTAHRLAVAAAPVLTVNGISAAQVVAAIEAKKETHA